MIGGINWTLLLIPALFLSMYAQFKISSSFNKYSNVASGSGYTGSQVARMILDRNNLQEIKIEPVRGSLTDHYDPRNKVIRLSQTVYNSNSVAAVSVAAHEVGHAIQHGVGYFPIIIRSTMAPIASIGSRFAFLLIFVGLLVGSFMYELGIILYLSVVLFQLITLPVEINASRRALAQLENGIIPREEIKGSKKVLSAAALTYIAATLVALAQLLRLISMSNRRRS